MRYPGYLLNPGDMFQVDPERVLYATGAPKDRGLRRASRHTRREIAEAKEAKEAEKEETSPEEAKSEEAAAEGEVKAEGEQPPATEQTEKTKSETGEEKGPEGRREALMELLAQ